jgi:hypothetical protein
VAAVGGSPIEYWMPPMPGSSPPGYFQNPCELDDPQCDNGKNDTTFYTEYIHKLVPYTLGGVIWGEMREKRPRYVLIITYVPACLPACVPNPQILRV